MEPLAAGVRPDPLHYSGQRSAGYRTANARWGYRIAARELSDGTLLALTLLTIAYSPTPPFLACFEEPDRGIHPRLLRHVQDALYRLAYPEGFGEARSPVQVIVTTHSPYFLDLFQDHPEEVVICSKQGLEANFQRLSELPNVAEIMEGANLGDVWYTGILGGVPAEP
jgi:predicted ATPase